MSIHLSEYLTSNHSVKENAAMRGASDAARPEQSAVPVKQGEHIRGTVIETDGNRAIIESKDHGVFSAELENGVRVEKGDMLDFEVRGMIGKQIALTPLYSNMSSNSSVMKALQAAGLPLSDANVRMVGEMMNQGMGIDRNSLHSMAGMVSRFAGYDPSLIVQMKQMGIPITQENVIQTEIYRNNAQQIQNSFAEVSGQMQSLMKEMAANGEYEALGRLFSETARLCLQEAVGGEAADPGAITQEGADAQIAKDAAAGEGAQSADSVKEEPAGKDNVQAGELRSLTGENAAGEGVQGHRNVQDGEISGGGNAAREIGDAQNAGNTQGQITVDGAGMPERTAASGNENAQGETAPKVSGSAQNAADIQGQTSAQGSENISGQNADHQHNGNAVRESASFLGGESTYVADAKDADLRQMQNAQDAPNISAFLERMTDLAKQNAASGAAQDYRRAGMEAARLLKQPGFAEEFENMLTKKWLLSPQQTADKEQVRRLYENVLKQTRQLLELLDDAGKQNSSAARSLQNMEKTVDFMNELNQQFAYVQLPLRMSQQNAHGDLYVYARKHKMTGRDDTVTAFLHLGMDHLGEMDIYVALSQNKVNTKFYLENEAVIDFLEGHMDELNERLKQKGYSTQTQVLPKEQEDKKSVFEVMLSDSAGAGTAPPIMLNHRSFDARA